MWKACSEFKDGSHDGDGTMLEFDVVKCVEELLSLVPYFNASPKQDRNAQSNFRYLPLVLYKVQVQQNPEERQDTLDFYARNKGLCVGGVQDTHHEDGHWCDQETYCQEEPEVAIGVGNQFVLPSLMPMIYVVNSLIKFAQSPTCHILDFM